METSSTCPDNTCKFRNRVTGYCTYNGPCIMVQSAPEKYEKRKDAKDGGKELEDRFARTPDGMLEALRCVAYMSADDQVKYFGVSKDGDSSITGLWLVVMSMIGAETIFERAEAYRADKEIEREALERVKVQRLADEIGIEKVASIAREILHKYAEKES